MSSFIKRFEHPLPLWISEIKKESREKIRDSLLILRCRNYGKNFNQEAMQTLMTRFWPFVDIFPKLIQKQKERIQKREMLRHSWFELSQLRNYCSDILNNISNDEKKHKDLWTETSEGLGLTLSDLDLIYAIQDNGYFEVQDIIDCVGKPISIFGNKVDSFSALLRFAAVEIVAEAISMELLVVFSAWDGQANQKAQDAGRKPPPKTTSWFQEHLYHKEGFMTHEELTYRLAFALSKDHPTKEMANKVIQEVVDLFVEAGDLPH